MKIDKGIPGIPTISASKLLVYKTCAQQFYYKYKVPYNNRPIDDKNVAALLGTAIHKAIEERYRNNENPVAVFQRVMDETITQWQNEGLKINFAHYYTTALSVGNKILRTFDWDQFHPMELEHAFTLPFPNKHRPIVNVTGYIDLIDSRAWVVYHKSASQAPNQDELDHNPQFIFYAWAYEQIYGHRPVRVIWNHVRTAKLYEANIYHNYEDKLEQLTNDIIAMIEAKHFVRRKMDKVCKTECSFFQNCYGDRASKDAE